MKRREFISLLGGAVAAWPLAARGDAGIGFLGVGLLDNYGLLSGRFPQGPQDALVGCDMSIMGTGIYGATPRWTRIGAIIVVVASRRGLLIELWLLGCWAVMAGG